MQDVRPVEPVVVPRLVAQWLLGPSCVAFPTVTDPRSRTPIPHVAVWPRRTAPHLLRPVLGARLLRPHLIPMRQGTRASEQDVLQLKGRVPGTAEADPFLGWRDQSIVGSEDIVHPILDKPPAHLEAPGQFLDRR